MKYLLLLVIPVLLVSFLLFHHQWFQVRFQQTDEENPLSSSSPSSVTIMSDDMFRSAPSTSSGHAGLVQHLKAAGNIRSELVERIFLAVDRMWFVPEREHLYAYADRPLPLCCGQTISAPHMHAMQLEMIAKHLKPGGRMLDVGSGSGVMLALASELLGPTGKAVGIEYVSELAALGTSNLMKIPKYAELVQRGAIVNGQGDGWKGSPEHAPYDAIHVGAAAETIPHALVQQLANGGRMVIPVGPDGGEQELIILDKDNDGKVHTRSTMGVMFVPLVKGHPHHH